MSLLEGELAGIISDSLQAADVPYDITVTVLTPGAGPGWNPGAPTAADHTCKGWRDMWTARERQDSTILAHDVKVMILAPTLSVDPRTASRVTIQGQTLSVVRAELDAAGALWTLQARA